ncbi:MAG: LytR/AlgR family response regulator transcription factor [Salibacteraceae bacterium]
MKTLLIDDEPEAIEGLKSMIQLFCPSLEVVGSANGIIEARQLIEAHHPELVFLDVEMPGGSGFDLLKQLPKPQFQTVFVTAYDQYAIRAVRFNAFDYLLKPIGPEELESVVERLEKKKVEEPEPEYSHLIESYKTGKFSRIGVPTVTGTRFIDLSDIIRLSADSNYTHVHLVKERKKLLVARTIKTFEEILEGTSFYRVHKSHLINLDHVNAWLRTDGGTLEMTNGDQVLVSRTRKNRVEELLRVRNRML